MTTPVYGQGVFLGGGGDKYSTLPPPVASLTAEGGNAEVTVSFETLAAEFDQYLGDPAYISWCLKKGTLLRALQTELWRSLTRQGMKLCSILFPH